MGIEIFAHDNLTHTHLSIYLSIDRHKYLPITYRPTYLVQRSTTQHSRAQQRKAQQRTAQRSTAQRSRAEQGSVDRDNEKHSITLTSRYLAVP